MKGHDFPSFGVKGGGGSLRRVGPLVYLAAGTLGDRAEAA